MTKTRILVIDDNATSRKLVTTLLAFEGYEVAQASDGAEGLAIARSKRPQLVISDILMPSMDGYEFVRRLREDRQLADSLVIFYTANYHEREARLLADRCRVSQVVVKPCPSSEFLRIVRQVLSHTPPARSLPSHEQFDAEHLRLLTDKLSHTAHELKVANHRLAALVELNVQLASERDPQTLLQRVCWGARDLLASRAAALAVTARSGSEAPLVAWSGPPHAAHGSEAFRLDAGLLGQVYQERRSMRVSVQGDAPLDTGLPSWFPCAQSLLAAPITSLTRAYGWLCLADKVGAAEFSPDDERMLKILCAQVGRIYENGSLYLEVQNHAAQLLVEMEERERTLAALRKSEEQFRQLAENIEDVFFIATADLARALYVSPGFERIWGRPAQALLDDPLIWIDSVHPDDRDRARQESRRIAAALPQGGEMQFRILRPDGTIRWVLTRVFPILGATGELVRAVGVSTDITERRLAEEKINHLNRVYSMISGINSLIIRAGDRAELLHEACRLAVEHGGFRIAWCGLVDPDGREVRPQAWAGDLPSRSADYRVSLDASAEGSMVVAAIRSQLPAVCNDLRDERADVAHRAELVERGYRAAAMLPLVVSKQAIGCIALITDETDCFDEEELKLLQEFTGDISFALDHLAKAERINYLAYYDTLTGLANRTLFVERLTQHVASAGRGQTSFALVFADPQRFDALNEAHGRAAGDQVLREIAARFVKCAGAPDLVGRLGSDQLAAIVPAVRSTTELARMLGNWWHDRLDRPYEVNGQNVIVSVRAGIVLFPSDGGDAEVLLHNAEASLRSGRDKTFNYYTADLSERLAERMTLEKNLQRALNLQELVLHYQPKVDVQTRRLTGVEALMRWNNPELGLVPPSKFIPLMEENGTIVEVGAWALRQATLDRARWLERRLAAPRIAVNVSAVQLRRDDFVDTVSAMLGPTGGEAGIDIEVTESLLMEDVDVNLKKLQAIQALGVGIALDDFGTGYSSLAYLAKLPVQTLKIDRSFVAAMLNDPGAMTLISTILSLARSLRLASVAEGVESEDQAKILRLLSCDQMQGYLVSQPLTFAQMTEFLSRA